MKRKKTQTGICVGDGTAFCHDWLWHKASPKRTASKSLGKFHNSKEHCTSVFIRNKGFPRIEQVETLYRRRSWTEFSAYEQINEAKDIPRASRQNSNLGAPQYLPSRSQIFTFRPACRANLQRGKKYLPSYQRTNQHQHDSPMVYMYDSPLRSCRR